VSCSFELRHYAELLEAARTGGYRFAFFDREPAAGEVLLRHDVDLTLEPAVEMAELEAELEIGATYFLMTRSELYNLDAASGEATLERLRALGHRIGLHGIYPDATLDERLDPIVAWHTPEPEYMTLLIEGAVNVMQPGYFDPDHYRSDSNKRWRHGCPHDQLAHGEFEWLQLLIHPELWVYPGETMRETMLALLDAERERRLEQLAAARIDLS
jgi:hypothetical protein